MVLSDILSPAYISLDSSIFNCRWSVDRICIQSSIKSVIAVTFSPCLQKTETPTGKKGPAPRRARGIGSARSGWGTHVSAPPNQPTDRRIVPDKEGALSTSPLPSPMGGPGCPVVRPSSSGRRGWPWRAGWRFGDQGSLGASRTGPPLQRALAASSSLLAATMIHKSSLGENRALSQRR